MKFRNLLLENPNHSHDWLAINHYSIYKRSEAPDAIQQFTESWRAGSANLSDWLKHETLDVDKLSDGLSEEQKIKVGVRRRQLYDWWLEYKARYKLLHDLLKVIEFAPWRVQQYAVHKLAEFEKYLNSGLKGFQPFMFTNSLGLQPNINYVQLMKEMEGTFESFDLIYDASHRHDAAVLLRHHQYLRQIAAEGIQDDEEVAIPDSDQISFSTYWPDITNLRHNLVVEYRSEHTWFDDTPYVSYRVTGLSGIKSGYGLRTQLERWFKPGFEQLLTELLNLDNNEQLDILNQLKMEAEVYKQLVTRDG